MSLAERRSVRRLAVSYQGELAIGTTLLPIAIADVSLGGCGVETSDVLADRIGEVGVLAFRGALMNKPLFPVIVANQREEDGSSRLGLRFRNMSKAQFAELLEVLEDAIQP